MLPSWTYVECEQSALKYIQSMKKKFCQYYTYFGRCAKVCRYAVYDIILL